MLSSSNASTTPISITKNLKPLVFLKVKRLDAKSFSLPWNGSYARKTLSEKSLMSKNTGKRSKG